MTMDPQPMARLVSVPSSHDANRQIRQARHDRKKVIRTLNLIREELELEDLVSTELLGMVAENLDEAEDLIRRDGELLDRILG